MSHSWFELSLKLFSRKWSLQLHGCLNFVPSWGKSVINPDIVKLLFFVILSHIFILSIVTTSFRLYIGLSTYSTYRIWSTLRIDIHLNILFIAIIFLFPLSLGLLFNRKHWQLLLCIFTLTTDDNHVSILIDSARVTCASTRLNYGAWKTFGSLRLNKFPLSDINWVALRVLLL